MILFVFFCANTSFADFSHVFSEDGIYNDTQYNIIKVEFFDLGGNKNYAIPGASDFSAGIWTVQMPSANYVVATDSTPGGTSSFDWTLWFTGSEKNAKLDLAYLAFTDTGEIYGTYIKLNKGTWTYPVISPFDPNDPRFVALRGGTVPVVPIPPSASLLGGGLIGLAALRRKTVKLHGKHDSA